VSGGRFIAAHLRQFRASFGPLSERTGCGGLGFLIFASGLGHAPRKGHASRLSSVPALRGQPGHALRRTWAFGPEGVTHTEFA
jgi:hypothetical protein